MPRTPKPLGRGPDPQPLAWAGTDTPERIAGRPDIRNETGDAAPRLLLMPLADGALRIAVSRQPLVMLRAAANAAKLRHTWVKSALVSRPKPGLGRACAAVFRRLERAGHRNTGARVFEAAPVGVVAAILRDIYPAMEPLPPEPVEPIIPPFPRQENPMQEQGTTQGLPALVIANTAIRQDQDGRYCLNDLHRAAGEEARHKPGNWLMLDQTKALAAEIEIAGIPAIH